MLPRKHLVSGFCCLRHSSLLLSLRAAFTFTSGKLYKSFLISPWWSFLSLIHLCLRKQEPVLADYSTAAHKYFGGNTVSSTSGGGKLSFYMHSFELEFNYPITKWIQSTSSHCRYAWNYDSEIPSYF
jgi:hypothetical protein